MLAGETYQAVLNTARELFKDFGEKDKFLTWPCHLRKLAPKFGCQLGPKVQFGNQNLRFLNNFTNDMRQMNLDCSAILAINYRQCGEWHWVVWDHERGRILDPRNRRYTGEPPYKRIRPWYYLIVRADR